MGVLDRTEESFDRPRQMTVLDLINRLLREDPGTMVRIQTPIYQNASDAPEDHPLEEVVSNSHQVLLIGDGGWKS